jgi:hypothetical protein
LTWALSPRNRHASASRQWVAMTPASRKVGNNVRAPCPFLMSNVTGAPVAITGNVS